MQIENQSGHTKRSQARLIRWIVLGVLVLPIIVYSISVDSSKGPWEERDIWLTIVLYVVPVILASFYAISWFSWWLVNKDVFPTAFRNIFKAIILVAGWLFVFINNLPLLLLVLYGITNPAFISQSIDDINAEEEPYEYVGTPLPAPDDNPSPSIKDAEEAPGKETTDIRQSYDCEHWIIGTVSSQIGHADGRFTFDIEEGDEAFPAGTAITVEPSSNTAREYGMKGLQWGMDGVIIGFTDHSETGDSVYPAVIVGNDDTTGKYWENS